ncbi:unnamed protein product [Allacma fusca]|uniref:Uncharacterized protein n=1 Tax=Allacma fusca TaxID=39272 RepID=A0A8J2P8G5_9HEXA|nr:unnamed protein product [Allacma fusca]
MLISLEDMYLDMTSDLQKRDTEFGHMLAENILKIIKCSEDESSSEDICETEKLRKHLLVDGVLKRYLLPLLERLVPGTQDYPISEEDVSSFCAKRRRAVPQSQINDSNLPL